MVIGRETANVCGECYITLRPANLQRIGSEGQKAPQSAGKAPTSCINRLPSQQRQHDGHVCCPAISGYYSYCLEIRIIKGNLV